MTDNLAKSYDWMALQEGNMVLSASGLHNPFVNHQCTSVLLWPVGENPSAQNTIIIDPCFTEKGYHDAVKLLGTMGLSFKDIGQVFITHNHRDHQTHFPDPEVGLDIPLFQNLEPESGIKIVPCPGHSNDSRAVVFRSVAGEQVWIAGDAILNKEWLISWMYYWPNNYRFEEIIQTWKSMTLVLSNADIVVPGHGKPIRITHELLSQLLPHLQQYAQVYKNSAQVIEERKEQLGSNMVEVLREKRLALNHRLLLVQGDITAEIVDAIVNAANSHLQHRGGVAGLISRRGGPDIQAESNAWVQKHGPVSHEEPAYTTGGTLSCRYIIHCVGPKWGSGKEDAKLTAAIKGSLRLADRLGLVSIAFPAISTGIFGFPKDRAARIMYNACIEYFKLYPASGIEQVRLMLFDEPTIVAFLSVWDKEVEGSESKRLLAILEKKDSRESNLTDEYLSICEKAKTEYLNYDQAFLQKWSQESKT